VSLSTRKKNQIIAEWKAGRFNSYYAVAKHHQISQPIAKKMLVNIDQSNVDIVRTGVEYETAKKLSKNLVEIKAIENEVANRIKVDNISNKILDKASQMISSNKTIEKVNVGDGMQSFQERELNSADLKNLADTVDKASVTLGVNQRHASSQVTVNNTNAQQNNDNNSNLITEALKAKYANK
jgi:hypothetical protein